MKKMRRLIPAIAMLLVSAVMLSTASFAWFSMSTKATAQGMTVKAEADSSLLIVDSKGKTLLVGDFQGAKSTVDLSTPVTTLSPAIIDMEDVDDDGNVVGNLITLDSASIEKVDPATGKAAADANYVAAVDGTNYYDYVVAVGAVGAGVSGSLTATVNAEVVMKLHNATSIAFYYKTCTDGTLADAQNYVATVTLEEVAAAGGSKAQKIVDVTDLLTVDEEALGDYVLVTMRVFFDGDNLDADGNCYAKNGNMTVENISFDVEFTIE